MKTLSPGKFYKVIEGRFKGMTGRAIDEHCVSLYNRATGEFIEISFLGGLDSLTDSTTDETVKWLARRVAYIEEFL